MFGTRCPIEPAFENDFSAERNKVNDSALYE